jgi:hypothetical protein
MSRFARMPKSFKDIGNNSEVYQITDIRLNRRFVYNQGNRIKENRITEKSTITSKTIYRELQNEWRIVK